MSIYFGLDIDEKLIQADAYYNNSSILKYDWSKLSDEEKQLGLAQAEREVNLYLGIDLEYSYSETDWPLDYRPNFRPDYAIFEHAYFILDNTVRTSTSKDGVIGIETSAYQVEEKQTGVVMSPQAERYLKINRVSIQRG